MNISRFQKRSPATQRLYSSVYTTAESRKHLKPMYTSVWLALYQGLMQSTSSNPAHKAVSSS